MSQDNQKADEKSADLTDPEDPKIATRRAMLASRLARDLSLQRAASLFAQAVYSRASSPDVARLATGLLLDIELDRRGR